MVRYNFLIECLTIFKKERERERERERNKRGHHILSLHLHV